MSSLLLYKLETTERTNYKHHNIHSIRWWRWKSSKLFFSLRFHICSELIFFFFGWLRFTDSILKFSSNFTFLSMKYFYWNSQKPPKMSCVFLFYKVQWIFFCVAFEAQSFCEFFSNFLRSYSVCVIVRLTTDGFVSREIHETN